MTVAAQLLDTRPEDLGEVDEDELRKCSEARVERARACADACLAEGTVAEPTTCVRTDLDRADLCDGTARVLSRHTGYDADLTRAVLETCRRCEQASRGLISSLG